MERFLKLKWQKLSFIVMLFVCAFGFAQTSQITGKVIDETGEPLPGASVLIEGTSNGTMTDFDGKFILAELENGNYQVLISYVGFSRKVISVSVPQSEPITVTLIEDATQLDDVVVTGVFDARTKMESSIAISTMGVKEMERLVPVSAADLIKNTPGVYVNSSAGEVRNTVYARGISANSNTSITNANNGYYYVSLQEDGLPVTAISDGLLVADLFFRNDATIKRLEAVRGGTSSITSVNAPGGIFNFLTKNGSEGLNEISARYGLEGDGQNFFFRSDINLGGEIKDGLYYNLGGFYRNAEGARFAGYSLNAGGQLKASVTKIYSEGSSFRVFAKYLNDRNALTMVQPAIGFDDIELAPGVNFSDSYLLPAGPVEVPDGRGGTRTFDPADANQAKDISLGFNWDHKLGNDWAIANNFKYSAKEYSAATNTATSFTELTDASTYFFGGGVGPPGSVGIPGTYTFTDRETGQPAAIVTQFLGEGPPWQVRNSDGIPEAAPNSLLYNGTLLNDSSLDEIMNQFTIGKKWDNVSINAGVFYSRSNIQDRSMPAATLSLSLIKDRPIPLDVSFAGVNGQTYQLSSPEGYLKLGGSFGYGDFDADVDQFAFFFGNNISALDDKLNFDWGFRLESSNIAGTVDRSVPNFGRQAGGGLDGNPLTVFDNFSPELGINIVDFDKSISGFSISGGLNYRLNENNAIYVRYARGEKAPDLSFYRSYTSQQFADGADPENQVVTQIEAAYKYQGDKLRATVTPFYSKLSNVTTISLTADENNQFYFLPPTFNSVRTIGVEMEVNWDIAPNFNLTAGGTIQNAEYVDWTLWDPGEAPRDDDTLFDYSGNEAENNPNIILNLTPTYATARFYALLNYNYLGKRQANQPNAYEIPGFGQLNFGMGYNVTDRLRASVNVNNVLNTFGVMTSLAPGPILEAFNPNRVTAESIAANPNAVRPVIAIQPRAYFLTFTYQL